MGLEQKSKEDYDWYWEQKEKEVGIGQPAGVREARPYSPLQLLILLRLAKLLRERRENTPLLQPDDWRMKLSNKAIYSTYRDAVEQGIAGDAKALLERDQTFKEP